MSGSATRKPRAASPWQSPSPDLAPKLLAIAQVSRRVSLGSSKIYELIAEGGFPKPLKVGRVNRWATREVDAWVEQQIAASER